MASYAKVAQNQLDAIDLIQTELLSRLQRGRIGSSVSELMPYFSLIEKALPLLAVMPVNIEEQLENIQVNQLLSLILNEKEGDTTMPIDQNRYDPAVAKLNELKSGAADDEANKVALNQAQAELKSAQEALGSLQAKVDQLTSDDEADKSAITQAKVDLQFAEEAVAAAEQKANALIDQIVPPMM
jgi:hypothetical protein